MANITNHALAEHAAEIRRLGKRAVADVIEIGRRLTECKRIAGRGNWLPWLAREFGWEETTALRFMRIHELAQSKSGKLPDLPVSGLYLLAAPSTPTETRNAVLDLAANGQPFSLAEIKGTIDAAKGREQPARKASTKAPIKPRDDLGPASTGELERLRERIEELQNENRRTPNRKSGAALRGRGIEIAAAGQHRAAARR